MKHSLTAKCALVLCLLIPVTMVYAVDDVDQTHPAKIVKDSPITSQINTKLTAGNPDPMKKVVVKTDANGVVWLSGSVNTQTLIDKAGTIARNTAGVTSVNNKIVVKTDE